MKPMQWAHILLAGLLLLPVASFASEKENDEIIIIDDSEGQSPAAEEKPSVWKDIKEHVFIRTESFIRGSYQLTNPVERPLRLLGSVWATAGLDPSDYFSVQVSAIGRIPVDFTWQSYANQPAAHIGAFADLYDSFIKIQLSNFTLHVGNLLTPWTATRGAAVNDRLNPIDYRRGPDFSANVLGRVPQWGALFRTSLFEVSIEGIFLFQYAPNKGSLAASDQGGVQIARYQGALMPSQTQMGDLLPRDRYLLEADAWVFQTPVLAGRLRRQLGDIIDAGINVSWGFNEVPTLNFPEKVSQFLAHRYSENPWVSTAGEFSDWPCGSVVPYSSREELNKCVGGKGALSHQRVLGFGFDLSMNVGAVVLRGEALFEPIISGFGGKTTVMVSKDAMRSVQLPSMTLALAADGEYGDWFTGSVELVDTIWMNVPAHAFVLGVEPLYVSTENERTVHRLALASAIEGTFFKKSVQWRLKGEAGLTQPDVLATFDVSHAWEALGLFLGAYTNLFLGIEGSPGWFRQNGTAFGVYVGHKL